MLSQLRREQINPALKSRVETELAGVFPITSTDGKTEIRASKIEVDDSGFDPSDLNAQQRAREQGGTRGARITGQLELIQDGKVAQRRKVQLGTLPLMNDLGTYSVGGNDWFTPMAQMRLKNGAYTREKTNGLYETFIRIKGRAMTLWMDPDKGVFKVGYGTTNVNWYPVMRALGVTDDEMVRELGGDARARELVSINSKTAGKGNKDLDRLYAAIFERKQNKNLISGNVIQDKSIVNELSTGDKSTAIQQWMKGTELDPFVTRQTLGKGFESISPQMLMSAARRILAVQRGDEEPDDRDASHFKTAHGVEDLMAERIRKLTNTLRRDAVKKMGKPGATLGKIFGRDWADTATVGYFGGKRGIAGGLAYTAEAANPLAILSEQSKLTLRGEGGIQSDHAITLGARLFRPGATGFIDPVRTPEGSQIGIMTHAAANTVRDGNTLKAPFYRVTKSKMSTDPVLVSQEEIAESIVSYPEYWDAETGKPTEDPVRANVKGKITDVPAAKVQYVIPSGASMFDHTSNAALFLAHTHTNRAMMAGKHLTQALPLVNREKPLVGLKDIKGRNVLEALARTFTIRSKVDGTVEKVTSKAITISGVKHSIYDRYPMQAKVSLHHVPVVKVGDKVKKGQLIADSNYSKEGELALGTNLRSAYMVWKNAGNFEDAIVVSESASKKLTSEHMHREHLTVEKDVTVGKKLFLAQFPTSMSMGNASKLDDSGLIKKGMKVAPGDVLIAAARKRSANEQRLGQIHKTLMRPYQDVSVKWEEEFPGEVVRVVRHGDEIEVHIRTEEPLQVGDKLSMSSAAKGTVSMIVPDSKMPRNKEGKHIEVVFNPHGVAGRMNPSQTIEQAAGKLVRDGGEKYDHANFDLKEHAREVRERLEKKGLSHSELLYDPEEGKWMERPVGTGYNYVLKLDHPVRKKFSARTRDGYTMDEAPTRGRGKGGQSYDQLTTYALLGHDAHAILRESFGIKGSKNDDFWRAYQAGETPPPPKTPFVFEKFRNYLTAAGVDSQVHGKAMHFMPLTEKRIMELSNGEITKARQVRSKDLAEEKGGLFDKKITGGLQGEHWAHLELDEKIPHPLYEKVVRDLTGMKQSEFYGLVAGTMFYEKKSGRFFPTPGPGRVTGQEAFELLLNFSPEAKLKDIRARLKTAVGSDRNRYHRATRYLRGLKETGMSPAEAYMTSKVPVVPPKFRSLLELGKGGLRVAPANTLYRDMIMTRDVLKQAKEEGTLPPDEMGKARLTLYDSYAALIGVGKSLTVRRDKDETPGFINVIKGKSNKTGLFQSQLARRRNDYTGRSTIEPDANLGVDEIGIPEEMAWKIYEPTVVRRLVLGGWKPADAMKQVQQRTLAARGALNKEMKERLVHYNRAPSLHRWSVASAVPYITPGKEIKISPSVIGPYGADFDGDQQQAKVFVEMSLASEEVRSTVQHMAARFDVSLPISENSEVYVVDLEDFPHGELIASKEGEKGRIDFYKALKGIRVLGYRDGRLEWCDVSGWSRHHDREVQIVDLKSGRQIYTDDDPRAVFGVVEGRYGRFTPSEALARGVLVPRAAKIESPVEREVILEMPEKQGRGHRLSSTVPVTPSVAYTLGAFVGDGWVSGGVDDPRQINICGAARDEDVVEAFEFGLAHFFESGECPPSTRHTFSADVPGRHGEVRRRVYCCSGLARFLHEMVGHRAHHKHLPAWFLTMPRDSRVAMFGGLMDTDGSLCISNGKKRPQLMGGYTTVNLRLAREVLLLAQSIGIRGRISPFEYRGKEAWQVSFSTVDLFEWRGEGMRCQRKLAKLRSLPTDYSPANTPAAAKADVVPFFAQCVGIPHYAVEPTLYSACRKALKDGYLSRQSAQKVLELSNFVDPTWEHWVRDTSVTWDLVVSVSRPAKRETGYDLTVPGTETFTAIDGVILSNTMSVHVPVTEEAKREAHKLLPSKNLYYDRDRSLAYGPEKDIIAGVFALTRPGKPSGLTFKSDTEAIEAYRNNKPSGLRMTSMVKIKGMNGQPTIGQLMFMHFIPPRFRVGLVFPIDKKKMNALLERVAKEAPAEFSRFTRHLSQAGFRAAAASGGITATVDELVVDRAKVNRLLDNLERDLRALKGTEAARGEAAHAIYAEKYKDKLHKMVEDHVEKHPVGYQDIIKSRSSSKANNDQFQQILLSPVMVQDVNDNVVPSVIKSSYGSGMRPSDYVMTTPGARAGLVARSLSTALPGFLAKEIAGNMGSVRVTEHDCGTKKGVDHLLSEDDADLLDRHLLRDIPGTQYKRNDAVTPRMLSELRDKKTVKDIWVRSSMTCEADPAPCQMCAGRTPDGKLHPIGANIGYNYGQAVSERSTQLTMRSFHSGGTVGAGDSLMAGFQRLRELLSAPDTVRNQGTLSDVAGTVTAIRPAPQGGNYVVIGNKEHYVASGRTVAVKHGQKVEVGDKLSDGNFRPQEIAAKKGTLAAQRYVVDEARQAYAKAGATVRKPVLEVVASGTMRYVEIIDDGGEDDLAPGDVIHENEYEKRRKKNSRIIARPTVPGISKKPLLTSNDLLERLNFQRLEDAIREVPAAAGKSDLSGSRSPIPGLAYGAKFRQDEGQDAHWNPFTAPHAGDRAYKPMVAPFSRYPQPGKAAAMSIKLAGLEDSAFYEDPNNDD